MNNMQIEFQEGNYVLDFQVDNIKVRISKIILPFPKTALDSLNITSIIEYLPSSAIVVSGTINEDI
jgi:hypothetical protein